MGPGDRGTVGPSERHGSALSCPSRFSAAILTPTPTDVGIISQNSIGGSLILGRQPQLSKKFTNLEGWLRVGQTRTPIHYYCDSYYRILLNNGYRFTALTKYRLFRSKTQYYVRNKRFSYP